MQNQKKPFAGGQGARHTLCVCLFVVVYVFVVFFVALYFSDVAMGASLAASAFIVFGYPKSDAARTRCLLGGYLCGVASGILFSLVLSALGPAAMGMPVLRAAFYALAAGGAAVAMLCFKVGHPPAAAMALALVSDSHPLELGLATLGCVLVLWGLHQLYQRVYVARYMPEE